MACMTLSEATAPLVVRLLWPSVQTPAAEIAAVKDLYAHLIGLTYSVKAWEAALLLYQTGKSPPPTIPHAVASRWRFIACNECVLELYHLRARLQRIQSVLLGACPSVRGFIDVAELKSARKRLDEYFPHIEALRHATAHKGEIEAFPKDHAPDGEFALAGFREPGRYSLHYKGELHFLDITPQTLQKIGEVVQEFISAFEPVIVELEKQGHIE